jgi:hypothetical protein
MRHLLSLLGVMLSFPAVAGELRDIEGRVVPMVGPQVVVAWSIAGGDAAECALLSEAALAEDWNNPDEDAAWQHLQQAR